MRKRITNDMIHYSYELAKKSFEGQINKSNAVEAIQRESGMSKRSANDFVNIFHCMMTGESYKGTTLSIYATEYYLRQIQKDFGDAAFRSALLSTKKHLEYYHRVGYKRPAIDRLVHELDQF